METETMPRKISGLNITCDHCAELALYRHETPAADHPGADVHWTCAAHKGVSA